MAPKEKFRTPLKLRRPKRNSLAVSAPPEFWISLKQVLISHVLGLDTWVRRFTSPLHRRFNGLLSADLWMNRRLPDHESKHGNQNHYDCTYAKPMLGTQRGQLPTRRHGNVTQLDRVFQRRLTVIHFGPSGWRAPRVISAVRVSSVVPHILGRKQSMRSMVIKLAVAAGFLISWLTGFSLGRYLVVLPLALTAYDVGRDRRTPYLVASIASALVIWLLFSFALFETVTLEVGFLIEFVTCVLALIVSGLVRRKQVVSPTLTRE